MVFGSTSLLLVLSAPSLEGPRTFAAAALGVTAVVSGTQALRRPSGWISTRLAARAGRLGGTVALGLLAYALAGALLLTAGLTLPALSFLPASSAVPPADAPAAVDELVSSGGEPDPLEGSVEALSPVVPAPPTSADAERDELARAAGTIAFVLRQRAAAGGAPPVQVVVTGASPSVLSTPQGEVLGALPDGVTVFYATGTGQTTGDVVLELRGGTFGQVARWDSATDVLSVG